MEHTVNLDLPPQMRWKFLANYAEDIHDLLPFYLNELKELPDIMDYMQQFKTQIISTEYLEEIIGIASVCRFTPDEILMANLYFDLQKAIYGCTAFAAISHDTILHARNLDWLAENQKLTHYTRIFDFQKNGKTVYKTVGWPGFIGALSGTKPVRFSLTLNAAYGIDAPKLAIPVTLLLRDVLSGTESFAKAQQLLENTPITSDCILLLSGTKKNELVVIERTPMRFATRNTEKTYIIATNIYQVIENNFIPHDLLQTTGCTRYERVEELLHKQEIDKPHACFNILSDQEVKMDYTVQQMVFDNKTGTIYLQ